MAIIEITPERLIELKVTTFGEVGLRERTDLQRLLRDKIDAIAPDMLVISEEFGGWDDSKRRVDLLAVDKAANLAVIELKRTEDGGHMELQALRYAAMVSQMTFEKAVEILQRYLISHNRNEPAQQLLLDFLGWDVPEKDKFAQDVRVVLASAEFSKELTSTVIWLNEHGLDIRCVRLRPYTDGSRIFLDVQQVIPLPEASEYFVQFREKREEERESRREQAEWTGLWFVNVGMDAADLPVVDQDGHGYERHWEHCIRYGYLAAGGGARYSDALKRLQVGDQVLAYQKGAGYVGYGITETAATPIDQFRLSDGSMLEDKINPSTRNKGQLPDKWEYAVGVHWINTVPLTGAKTFRGAFANQNVVCKLRDEATIAFLRKEFSINDSSRRDNF